MLLAMMVMETLMETGKVLLRDNYGNNLQIVVLDLKY